MLVLPRLRNVDPTTFTHQIKKMYRLLKLLFTKVKFYVFYYKDIDLIIILNVFCSKTYTKNDQK